MCGVDRIWNLLIWYHEKYTSKYLQINENFYDCRLQERRRRNTEYMEQIEREFLEEQRRKMEVEAGPPPDKAPDERYGTKTSWRDFR